MRSHNQVNERNRLISAIITLAAAFLLSLEAKKKTAGKNSQPFLSHNEDT
jgi:hypothetical protein